MKLPLLILPGFLVVLLSCEPTPFQPTITTCITLTQHPSWPIEDFKKSSDVDLTIQFPTYYQGGLTADSSVFFSKMRNDGKVAMEYRFCDPADGCSPFGEPIVNEFPRTLTSVDVNNEIVTLDNFSTFCEDGDLVAVLYYNHIPVSTGKLYMLHEDIFLEAMTIEFDSLALDEVEEILTTIEGY
ncbi:MAG: hypothetical protein AAF587_02680 [Bacteroidota bacterium]